MGVAGQRHAPAALSPGKRLGTHCIGGSGPVWTGAENVAHTVIRSPDFPARSESLYRLSYPGPFHIPNVTKIRPVGAAVIHDD